MIYALPSDITHALGLSFPSPVRPHKNPSGQRGRLISTGDSSPPILGYRVKQWSSGSNGDHNARWRKCRGLGHGMRSKKFIVAKTARG